MIPWMEQGRLLHLEILVVGCSNTSSNTAVGVRVALIQCDSIE